MFGSRGGDRGSGPPPPLKNHKNIGSLSNSGPDTLINHKATKPAFNVGSSWARQQNAIKMGFRWRADDDPNVVVFGSYFFSSKKRCQSWTPSDKTFWICAWDLHSLLNCFYNEQRSETFSNCPTESV